MQKSHWDRAEMVARVTWHTWHKEELPASALNPFHKEKPVSAETHEQLLEEHRAKLDAYFGPFN